MSNLQAQKTSSPENDASKVRYRYLTCGNRSSLTYFSQDQAFRLPDLPPELGVRVCRFAVVQDIIRIETPDNPGYTASAVAQPALSRTCKFLREETLKLFYAGNEFRVIDNNGDIAGGLGD